MTTCPVPTFPGCASRSIGLGLLLTAATWVEAAQIDLVGPAGSSQFGEAVAVLPNGNIVVVDPSGPVSNVGAVYLYSPTGALISTLTGSSANDMVGRSGIFVLPNGNFVVASGEWNNGAATSAGAVTWVDGSSGLSGVVSSANSLVGTSTNDRVGGIGTGVFVLSNGHYVVRSPQWDNGAIANAGAVTWANGATGISGAVSASNSLVGTTALDSVGETGIAVLPNGNYVVASNRWDNGATVNTGAVTWANGASGRVGAVSASNSLVGTTAEDRIGAVRALSNSHYVVYSSDWNNGAVIDVGAAIWCNGASGCSGIVSPANALIGSTAGDAVGILGIVALTNGNYVVRSREWDNGPLTNVGAVTWANGSGVTSAVVSAANSLIGSSAEDKVGDAEVRALSNGHYVVPTPAWDDGAIQDAGAVTWCNGGTGCSGAVAAGNSLIGSTTGDVVGLVDIVALTNGNYVVVSSYWDRGTTVDAGAATWANGSSGLVGVVSLANSLVGSSTDDRIGIGNNIALPNGNYVINSPFWNNGLTFDAGAATWGDGSIGVSGTILSIGALVGPSAFDRVGGGGVRSLSDGNYLVLSPEWDDSGLADAGAVTWCNGTTGRSGGVYVENSLIGTTAGDRVGSAGAFRLGDGRYVVESPNWDDGAMPDAGAVTLAREAPGLVGTISAANSVRGTGMFAGFGRRIGYDLVRRQLAVGRPASNIVSLFTLPPDVMFANGFE